MSRASYVAEMNLSASISRSNWWQLACWSVDDFITGLSPSPYWISANRKPTGTPNGGSFRRGPAISNQGLNRGSAKIVLAPSQQTAGRGSADRWPAGCMPLGRTALGRKSADSYVPTISNHLVPFLLLH